MQLSCSFAEVILERIGPDGVDPAGARPMMSPEEVARGARFYFPKDRDQHARSRWVLRTTLSPKLGLEPAAIQFSQREHGKPFLPDFPNWEFNLSHSGGWMALATNSDGLILGVDVEVQRADFPALEIADRFFRPAECERLHRCLPDERAALFFHLWTAKEAIMKATGQGFALAPRSIEVALNEENLPTGYALLEGVAGKAGDWKLESWRPFPGVVVCATARLAKS